MKVARRIRGETRAATDADVDVVEAALKLTCGVREAAREIVRARGEPGDAVLGDSGEGETERVDPHVKAGARPASVASVEASILKGDLDGKPSNFEGEAVGAAAGRGGGRRESRPATSRRMTPDYFSAVPQDRLWLFAVCSAVGVSKRWRRKKRVRT